MTKYIEALAGHVKRAGSPREKKALGIFARGAAVSGPSKLAAAKFGDAVPHFRLSEGFHAGVVVGITLKEG